MAPPPLLFAAARRHSLVGYALMSGVAIGGYLLIRLQGEGLVAPPGAGLPSPPAVGHGSPLADVLLALVTVTVLARGLGRGFERWLGQPRVIGEIVAGIVLGPSVLGALAPSAQGFLISPGAMPYVGLIAKVGVVLFMFLVGLELDSRMLRGNGYATLAVAHASIVAPFLLGALVALGIYPLYSSADVSFTVFSLFLGVSLAVTAFPVLARILTDRRVQNTPLGATALACAAVGDVSAWILLAFVSSVATAKGNGIGSTLVLVALYVAVMLLVIRPMAARVVSREDGKDGPLSQTVLAGACVVILLSSLATEAIGIHALFGAFLLGAILPHEGRVAEQLRVRLEDIVVVLFLPSFFAFSGMQTRIQLLDGAADWLLCGVIIAAATLGKFGGSFVAARSAGLGARESSALGILMNTRGLMELVVLNIGLELGVITPTVFAALMLMALVTTFATTPLLQLVIGDGAFATAGSAARQAEHALGDDVALDLARAGVDRPGP